MFKVRGLCREFEGCVIPEEKRLPQGGDPRL